MINKLRFIDFIYILGIILIIYFKNDKEKMVNLSSNTLDAIRNIHNFLSKTDGTLLDYSKKLTINGNLEIDGVFDTIKTDEITIVSSKKHLKKVGNNLKTINGTHVASYSRSGDRNYAYSRASVDTDVYKIAGGLSDHFNGIVFEALGGASQWDLKNSNLYYGSNERV